MRDLELRGAGNLLGDEQSGHVAAIGFELYCELLAEAVAELQGEAPPAVAAGAASMPRSTPTCPPTTCRWRRSRSTCTAGWRWPPTAPSCASSTPSSPTGSARCPEPVANLIALQEARLAAGELGAEALTLRGGRMTVAPLTLTSAHVAELKRVAPNALYTLARREVSRPVLEASQVLETLDAILEIRREIAA